MLPSMGIGALCVTMGRERRQSGIDVLLASELPHSSQRPPFVDKCRFRSVVSG